MPWQCQNCLLCEKGCVIPFTIVTVEVYQEADKLTALVKKIVGRVEQLVCWKCQNLRHITLKCQRDPLLSRAEQETGH